MSQDWYLMGNLPVFNSGYESDEFNDYAIQGFNELLNASPMYTEIEIYDLDLKLIKKVNGIVQNNDSNTIRRTNERQILCKIGTFKIGMCLKFKDKFWLISSIPDNNKIYEKCIVKRCNYTLPFQIDSVKIYNTLCVVEDKPWDAGEDKNKIVTTRNSEKQIYVQYNDYTKYLLEDKRIFIDANTNNPRVYYISNVNRINDMDNGFGLWKLTCVEDERIHDKDRSDLLIADYISIDLIPLPPPTAFGNCFIANTKNIVYNKPVELKIGGGKKPFVAKFKDTDNNDVDSIPVWNLIDVPTILVDKIQVSYNFNYPLRCYIEVADENSLIGNSFKLHLKDDEGKLTLYEITCKVVSFI